MKDYKSELTRSSNELLLLIDFIQLLLYNGSTLSKTSVSDHFNIKQFNKTFFGGKKFVRIFYHLHYCKVLKNWLTTSSYLLTFMWLILLPESKNPSNRLTLYHSIRHENTTYRPTTWKTLNKGDWSVRLIYKHRYSIIVKHIVLLDGMKIKVRGGNGRRSRTITRYL